MVESHCSAPSPISLPPSELRCAPPAVVLFFKLTEGHHQEWNPRKEGDTPDKGETDIDGKVPPGVEPAEITRYTWQR
jgi:hypothetical protein